MLSRCPGSENMRTPTLATRKCPNCGSEVEVFSTDAFVQCKKCGWNAENADTDVLYMVQVWGEVQGGCEERIIT